MNIIDEERNRKKKWIERDEKNDEQQTIINEHTCNNSKEQSIITQFIPIIYKNKKRKFNFDKHNKIIQRCFWILFESNFVAQYFPSMTKYHKH